MGRWRRVPRDCWSRPVRGPPGGLQAWRASFLPPYPGVPALGSGLGAQGSPCAFSEDVSFRPGLRCRAGSLTLGPSLSVLGCPTGRAKPQERPPGSPQDGGNAGGEGGVLERSPLRLRVVTFTRAIITAYVPERDKLLCACNYKLRF